ncbi:MAG: YdhR family protein [Anaerolineales bacterium]|nr:YdhR family protein [Anaerolineales bacterium]
MNEAEGEAGGIYLFEDEASVKAFLGGPLAAQVTGHPALSEFSVKQFDVMEKVTEITRGPV